MKSLLFAVAWALALPTLGYAQGYPNKPIRVVKDANIKAE